MLNLLINAVHAIPERGAKRNEVRLVTSTDATGHAVIEVCDTGVGIALEILPRIFDPFFTTKPVGAGTGLGLSICYTQVRGMGGSIDVESKVGEGTTFRVVLPAATREARAALVSQRPPAAIACRRAAVLVVDDEPLLGKALSRILSSHDVNVVTSTKDALALLETGKEFVVILSDLMMPVSSGMELYEELARTSPTHASRVIFMTGGAFTPDAAEFLKRIPTVCFEKPFDADTVRALVAERVKRQP